MKTGIRVGTGSGFSDDRFEPAADLAERGSLAADAHGNRLSHVMPSIVLPGDG